MNFTWEKNERRSTDDNTVLTCTAPCKLVSMAEDAIESGATKGVFFKPVTLDITDADGKVMKAISGIAYTENKNTKKVHNYTVGEDYNVEITLDLTQPAEKQLFVKMMSFVPSRRMTLSNAGISIDAEAAKSVA